MLKIYFSNLFLVLTFVFTLGTSQVVAAAQLGDLSRELGDIGAALGTGCIGECRSVQCCGVDITLNPKGVGLYRDGCKKFMSEAKAEEKEKICKQLLQNNTHCPEIVPFCNGGGSRGRQAKDCRPHQGPYKYKDKAIEAALEALADCLGRCGGQEMCGSVVKSLGDNNYYINVAKPGTGSTGCNPLDYIGNYYGGRSSANSVVATYHSHPNENSKNQENFSDFYNDGKKKGDKYNALLRNAESHLLTPQGVHKKFDPSGKDNPETDADERVEVVEKKIEGFKLCSELQQ